MATTFYKWNFGPFIFKVGTQKTHSIKVIEFPYLKQSCIFCLLLLKNNEPVLINENGEKFLFIRNFPPYFTARTTFEWRNLTGCSPNVTKPMSA